MKTVYSLFHIGGLCALLPSNNCTREINRFMTNTGKEFSMKK